MSANLYDRLSRISAFAPVRRSESPVIHENPHEALARLGAELGSNAYGEYAVARNWYATPETCEPSAEVLRLLLPRADNSKDVAIEQALDSSKWLFLDTETTGLAGGTGTYAFMIGLAWWESGGIRIEQLFMRDFDEEHSILLALAERLKERPVLVTFNGKCFDWPLLQNRFRMTRQIEIPSLDMHLDLLHPARRLWRLRIGSVRLKELEHHILGAATLGWSRTEDIDSSRIPEFYFDFVRRGAVDGVAGVFHHNRMDLRGLAALAGRVFESLSNLDGEETVDRESLELYCVSRLLSGRGEHGKARRVCERSLHIGLPESVARKATHEAAKFAKRAGDLGRATELWQELVASKEPSIEALEQLAIHYERQKKNYVEAGRVTRLALSELRRCYRLGLIKPRRFELLSTKLNRRMVRLEARSRR
jgi:uncharacterized protein YprB with RNaseH-like and TPR domain